MKKTFRRTADWSIWVWRCIESSLMQLIKNSLFFFFFFTLFKYTWISQFSLLLWLYILLPMRVDYIASHSFPFFCPCTPAFVVLSLDTLYVQFVWLWYSFEVWFGTQHARRPWSCVKQVIWFLIAWWLDSFTFQNHTSSGSLRNPSCTRKIQVLKDMPRHICSNMCCI